MTATADYSDGKVPKNETTLLLLLLLLLLSTLCWVGL